MTATMVPAHPLYIGPGNELFGLYHASTTPSTVAILLCPPMGQDMIRSHRVYWQLREALAMKGIASLRFDYYGSGDSAGASRELD